MTAMRHAHTIGWSDFKPTTLTKADRLRDDPDAVRVDPTYGDVFWVTSSRDRSKTYRVQLGAELAWASCTCPHGANAGGRPTCYHVAAALKELEATGHGMDPDEDDEEDYDAWEEDYPLTDAELAERGWAKVHKINAETDWVLSIDLTDAGTE